jgi:hypothetical protein
MMDSELLITGILLVAGVVIFAIGNGVTFYSDLTNRMWSEPVKEAGKNPRAWRWSHNTFLAGAVLTLVGFGLLAFFLYEAGSNILAPTCLILLVLGTTLLATYIGFSNTVTVRAGNIYREDGEIPAGYDSLSSWTYELAKIYMVLGFLSIAAIGGALLQAEFLASWLGWVSLIMGLVATLVFLSGYPRFPGSTDESIAHLPHWIYLITLIIGVALIVEA